MASRRQAFSPRYRWAILVTLWLVFMIANLLRLSIGPLGPFLRHDLALSGAQLGLLVSASALGLMAMLIPAGLLVDRIHTRWMILAGSTIISAALLAASAVGNFTGLLVCMVGAGVGMGCLYPANTKALMYWFPPSERATAMGLIQTAVNVGGVAAAALLPSVASAFGWNRGFLLFGAAALAVGLLALLVYRDPAPRASDAVESASGFRHARAIDATLLHLFTLTDMWLVVMGSICFLVVEFSAMSYFSMYLKESLLYPAVTAGFFLALLEAGGGVGKPINGFISDRILGGKRRLMCVVLAVAASLACAAFALFPAGISRWALAIVAVAFGVAGIGWGGLQLTLVSELAGKELVGRVTSVIGMVSITGIVAGPPIFGKILDATRSYAWSWAFLSVMGLLAALLFALMREGTDRPVFRRFVRRAGAGGGASEIPTSLRGKPPDRQRPAALRTRVPLGVPRSFSASPVLPARELTSRQPRICGLPHVLGP